MWRAVKNVQNELPQDVFKSTEATFSGAGAKEDAFELSRQPMIDLANKHKLKREANDSSESVESMPVFSGANRVVIDSREGTGSANGVTLASGTIREGADTDSSGTSQKGVPFLAFPSNSSQSFKPCSQSDLPSYQSDSAWGAWG